MAEILSPPIRVSFSVPFFPDEVITEILSWLPVKPVLRFKRVCKLWNSIISDPKFIKLHLHRSSTDPHLLLDLHTPLVSVRSNYYNTLITCSMRSTFHTLSLHVPDDHFILNCKYKILGSCNGFVCLLASSSCKYSICFWNPEMNLKSTNSPSLVLNLGHTSPDLTKFGYGYDKLTDTYKVVALFKDFRDDLGTARIRVYAMGDHSWRDVQIPFPGIPQSTGNFLSGNGTLNWLASPNYVFYHEPLRILSLDLGTETCRQFSLPVGCSLGWESDDEARIVLPTIGVVGNQPTLGVLGDCLCLSYDSRRTHYVVWQMKEFGVIESWTQLLNVGYRQIYIPGRINFALLVPLCISEDGNVVMLLHCTSEVIFYNRRDKRMQRGSICNNRVWAKDHVQSLIMPH